LEESAFLDGLDGALIGTGAAADTNVGIDYVLLVAFGDSFHGALVGARAALDASTGDFVSHDISLQFVFLCGVITATRLF
jgi:hypothetical protein